MSTSKTLVKFNNLSYEPIEIKFINITTTTSHDPSIQLSSSELGLTIAGYCPSYIENIQEQSMALKAGLKQGDLLMKINQVNCCRATLKTISSLIKQTNLKSLNMTIYRSVVTPNKVSRSSVNHRQQQQQLQHKRVILTPKVNKHHRSSSASVTKPSRNAKIFTKLFKPSLWLSCAQSIDKTNATFYFKDVQPTPTPAATDLGDSNQNLLVCKRNCCDTDANKVTRNAHSTSDTGYETISRYESLTNSKRPQNNQHHHQNSDLTIETVTDTTNSYSQCDLTINSRPETTTTTTKTEKYNEYRTQLIGNLIEMEANFVSYLSMAVSTFTRPLRGFFLKQQDYFNLFQNIEKILIISENFLRSMDKWSAFDLYSRIGQFYMQKLNLFRDAFTIYVRGYAKSKSLLNELKSQSKQFRLFLNEVQSDQLTLSNLLDLPIIHMQQTLDVFKQIRRFSRQPSELPHFDSVIFDLKKILLGQEEAAAATAPFLGQVDKFVDESESSAFSMSESTIYSSHAGGSSQNSDCTLYSTDDSTSSHLTDVANLDSILNIRF